jgi:TonB family protein
MRIRTVITFFLLTGVMLVVVNYETSNAAQRRRQIPEVEVPCSPEEAKWWEEIRTTGIEVQKSRGAKRRKEFLKLLADGKTSAYQPPVLDRRPTVLAMVEPRYSEQARRDQVSGAVTLQVEFQSNGTVGEVVVVNGLRSDLDRNATEAARLTAFLPAVKDRQFVTVWMPMEMSFHVY